MPIAFFATAIGRAEFYRKAQNRDQIKPRGFGFFSEVWQIMEANKLLRRLYKAMLQSPERIEGIKHTLRLQIHKLPRDQQEKIGAQLHAFEVIARAKADPTIELLEKMRLAYTKRQQTLPIKQFTLEIDKKLLDHYQNYQNQLKQLTVHKKVQHNLLKLMDRFAERINLIRHSHTALQHSTQLVGRSGLALAKSANKPIQQLTQESNTLLEQLGNKIRSLFTKSVGGFKRHALPIMSQHITSMVQATKQNSLDLLSSQVLALFKAVTTSHEQALGTALDHTKQISAYEDELEHYFNTQKTSTLKAIYSALKNPVVINLLSALQYYETNIEELPYHQTLLESGTIDKKEEKNASDSFGSKIIAVLGNFRTRLTEIMQALQHVLQQRGARYTELQLTIIESADSIPTTTQNFVNSFLRNIIEGKHRHSDQFVATNKPGLSLVA